MDKLDLALQLLDRIDRRTEPMPAAIARVETVTAELGRRTGVLEGADEKTDGRLRRVEMRSAAVAGAIAFGTWALPLVYQWLKAAPAIAAPLLALALLGCEQAECRARTVQAGLDLRTGEDCVVVEFYDGHTQALCAKPAPERPETRGY